MTFCCGRIRNLTPALGVMVVLAGCARPEPVLYPNAHLNAVGQETVECPKKGGESLARAGRSMDQGVITCGNGGPTQLLGLGGGVE